MLATTVQLARRLETAATAYLEQRYSGPGNPMGTQFFRQDGLLAAKVPFVPTNPLMNGVHGLSDADQLTPILTFYAETQQPCWIDVLPSTPLAVTTALVANGFRPDRYTCALYAAPPPVQHQAPGVDVGPVSRNDLNAFLDTLNEGFGVPAQGLANLRRNQSFWPDVPDWQLFLARVDGHAAGAAVLSVHGDIGYLAAAATLPAFRNRGVHRALLDARIQRAHVLGCTMMSVQADWGSSSQRNQQRMGLQMAYVKTVWTNHSGT